MKIEFIKETKLDGDVYYYTQVDGVYITKSMELNREKGYQIFERIKANGVNPSIEVLETFETEQTPY